MQQKAETEKTLVLTSLTGRPILNGTGGPCFLYGSDCNHGIEDIRGTMPGSLTAPEREGIRAALQGLKGQSGTKNWDTGCVKIKTALHLMRK